MSTSRRRNSNSNNSNNSNRLCLLWRRIRARRQRGGAITLQQGVEEQRESSRTNASVESSSTSNESRDDHSDSSSSSSSEENEEISYVCEYISEEQKERRKILDILFPEQCQPSLPPSSCSPTCTICLEVMEPGQLIVTSETCQHAFHRACAFDWMMKSQECPNCRESMWSSKVYHQVRNDEEEQSNDGITNSGDALANALAAAVMDAWRPQSFEAMGRETSRVAFLVQEREEPSIASRYGIEALLCLESPAQQQQQQQPTRTTTPTTTIEEETVTATEIMARPSISTLSVDTSSDAPIMTCGKDILAQ